MFTDFIEWIKGILRRLGFRLPRLKINPKSGPTGTQVTLTLDGMKPGEPITVTIGPGHSSAHADQNGKATITEIMMFEPGTYDIIVVVGSNPSDEVKLKAKFTVTS